MTVFELATLGTVGGVGVAIFVAAVGAAVAFGKLSERVAHMDVRFDGVDARFDAIDTRFAGVDARFDRMDARFDRINERFERLETRMAGVEQRQSKLEGLLEGLRDAIFERASR